jgi:hypothetical protein
MLWEASDRLCSKRLKPLVPVLLPALEQQGQLDVDGQASRQAADDQRSDDGSLLSVRVGSRRATPSRRNEFGGAPIVPIHTFGGLGRPTARFFDVDFVAHSGTSSSCSFVQTMVPTDITTGWT